MILSIFSDCLFLGQSSSYALRQTLLRLMEEVRRKEGIIQDLLTTLRSSRYVRMCVCVCVCVGVGAQVGGWVWKVGCDV